MARDWEQTLSTWGKPASDTEVAKRERTERAIREALAKSPTCRDLPLNVYAKGSYANRTNVRGDSDVDVNVEYHGIYFYDFAFGLEGKSGDDFGWTGTDGKEPTPKALKDLVEEALVGVFGSGAVTRRNKALEVKEGSSSLAADVVPCFTYHRYDRLDQYGKPVASVGTKLFPDSGGAILNWPQQHYDNGVAKNRATGERFKKIVRCLKRLENEMVEKGVAKEVPSYLVECLVYNAPDDDFRGSTLMSNLRAVLATVFNATLNESKCSEWVEVNELKYLFKGNRKWTWQDAHWFADSAWDYIGFGK
jgi:hypothetical protein